MNERPTPETDAIWKDYYHGELSWVDLHFAMQDFERELAEAREELEDWRNAAKGAENPHPDEVHCTCVPLLHKMLKDAREAFAIVTDQLVQAQMDNRKLHEEIQRLRDIEP